MSKIEDALNKAKKEGKKASSVHNLSLQIDNLPKKSSYLLAVNKTSPTKDIDRRTSSKEIALMKEGGLLDEAKLSEMKIIRSDMRNKKVANSYRDLRTQLLQKSKGENFIVMVTSCYSSHDSGSVALNLARAFAFDEHKTSLLIDCDFNDPIIDKMLDLKFNSGLTDYLHDEEINIEETIHDSGISRLRIIPSGSTKETSIEYFTSQRIKELMSELSNRYSDRYIFMNSAPITQSADTRILAELADYVLLIVPHGRVTKKTINEAADVIGKEKLLGVVFNDMPKIPKIRIPLVSRPIT